MYVHLLHFLGPNHDIFIKIGIIKVSNNKSWFHWSVGFKTQISSKKSDFEILVVTKGDQGWTWHCIRDIGVKTWENIKPDVN